MLGANRIYVKDTNSTTNYFGFDLGYDKDTLLINGGNKFYTAKQYNGNITGMLWKSTGDDRIRKYDFSYDAANRPTDASFTQLTSNAFNLNAGLDFSVKGLSYDANGNILTMNQRGWKIGGSLTIDSMLYTYYSGTNRLKNVLDRLNDTATKLGDFRSSKAYMTTLGNNKTTSATDYSYDVNGNMNVDNNKDISAIFYNHLNLPDSIVVTGKGSIKYIYDANGIKWKKIIHETNKPDRTTLYMGATVFENDTLQFISHEEGRTRFRIDNNSLHYDYFLKDHLGNVRMVLTDEYRQDVYMAATLENVTYNGGTAVSKEDDYYSIDILKIVNQPGGVTYQNNNGNPPYNSVNSYSNTNANSAKMYQLNASTNKTGLGIAIKVMAGDVINIYGKSYYSGSSGGTSNLPVNDLVSALLATSGLSGKGYSVGQINTPTLSSNLGNFLSNGRTQTVKAYVNWILFDEQFNFAGGGFDPVNTTSGAVKTHNAGSIPSISVAKSGYIFVYCSNESILNVLFDNLQVIHTRGALVEETHYYPFGLTMAGLSSKDMNFGRPPNKENTFQNQRFDDEFGVNWVQFKWRNHDPQTGRFIEIDPIAEDYRYNSTYAFSENKVIAHVEIEGLEAQYIIGKAKQEIASIFQSAANWFDQFTVGSKSKVEQPIERKTTNSGNIITTENTAELRTNFGELMNYIIRNNSNEGYVGPYFKSSNSTTVSVGTKLEVNTPVASGSVSATTDQNGKTTVTGSASIKTSTGLNVGAVVSESSDGTKKVGVNVSASNGNSTIKAGTTVATSDGKKTSVEASLSTEQKVNGAKVTNSIFIKKN